MQNQSIDHDDHCNLIAINMLDIVGEMKSHEHLAPFHFHRWAALYSYQLSPNKYVHMRQSGNDALSNQKTASTYALPFSSSEHQ